MLDASTQDRFVELTRRWLAVGGGYDEVLGKLRQRGLDKPGCVLVFQAATGMGTGEAKLLVHRSEAWADRREVDEYLEDLFWRAVFTECVINGGRVDEPAELATECRERQQRAAEELQEVAAGLPDAALSRYREAMAGIGSERRSRRWWQWGRNAAYPATRQTFRNPAAGQRSDVGKSITISPRPVDVIDSGAIPPNGGDPAPKQASDCETLFTAVACNLHKLPVQSRDSGGDWADTSSSRST